MPGIAASVERMYPEELSEQTGLGTYVFVTATIPPRYAIIDYGDNILWGSGPLTEDQMRSELAVYQDNGDLLVPDTQPIGANFSYTIKIEDVQYNGEYPGGPDRLALNVARLILGA